MKKILIIVGVLLVFSSTGIYLFDRFIYPVKTFLPGNKPWKDTPGSSCNFSGCEESEMNKIYNYYSELAVKEKDPSFCDKVSGIDNGDYFTSKDSAINLCKAQYGGKLGDFEYCFKLSSEAKGSKSLRDICLSSIITDYLQDESLCPSFPKDTLYASPSVCYSEMAYKKSDVNLCLKIDPIKGSKDFWQKSCIMRVGTKTKDTSVCSYLGLEYSQSECIKTINSAGR